LNNIKNIIINSVAVGDSQGTLTLYYPDEKWQNSGWASVIPTARKTNEITVDMMTIDSYVAEKNISNIRLIKMDIEGAEYAALSGMKNLLSAPNAPDLICEINPFLFTKMEKDSRLLTELLAGFGYSIYLTNKLQNGPVDPSSVINSMSNIFCTKTPSQVSTLT
jgi:FkbM family methyltransferase